MLNNKQNATNKPLIKFLKETKEGKYIKVDRSLLNCTRINESRQIPTKTYLYGIK